jgi:NAD(P)-dependent dehydrogenase (short-subunit alcohol dehydrogenase family)
VRVGIVVGAGGGIGSACARALDGSADRLLLAGRTEASLRTTSTLLSGACDIVVADVTDPAGREAIARMVENAGGEIAWLVLGSGVPLRGTFKELPADHIAQTFLTNLVGPALLVRRLLDCQWQRDASIVAIGSISASRSLPNRAVYSGSKAGLEHFCRSLAPELAELGIRINVVSPGVVETHFLTGDRKALDSWVETHVPQKRIGPPEDVAAVVRYLIVEGPRFVTGSRVAVDGGAEARA